MPEFETRVTANYGGDGLYQRILDALSAAGKDVANLAPADLQTIDEFHIGGPEATAALLDDMDLKPGDRLLDVGSGIGGPSRFAAGRCDVHVTGIDLTGSFVDAATRLSEKTGLSGQTRFVQGSALAMPFDDDSFDAAMMLHVGMNLPDKAPLMREAARVLKPGSLFAVYDVMRTAPGDFAFPVPWATSAETSFVEPAADYLSAAASAGFEPIVRRELGATASAYFSAARERAAEAGRTGAPPEPGIELLMTDRATRVANIAAAVDSGILAPVEIILRLS